MSDFSPNAPRSISLTRRGLIVGALACASSALAARYSMAQAPLPLSLDLYQRSYFSLPEWKFILAATSRLIPSEGDGPGALEARVPIFIDRQLAAPWGQGDHWYRQPPFDMDAPKYTGYQAAPSPAQAYRLAIAAIDAYCRATYGSDFVGLSADKQDVVLKLVENDGITIDQIRSSDFFSIFLQNTKEGYLADPQYGGNYDMAAWVYIGFPGARASFLEWVEKDNVPYRLGPVSVTGERVSS